MVQVVFRLGKLEGNLASGSYRTSRTIGSLIHWWECMGKWNVEIMVLDKALFPSVNLEQYSMIKFCLRYWVWSRLSCRVLHLLPSPLGTKSVVLGGLLLKEGNQEKQVPANWSCGVLNCSTHRCRNPYAPYRCRHTDLRSNKWSWIKLCSFVTKKVIYDILYKNKTICSAHRKYGLTVFVIFLFVVIFVIFI